MMKSTETTPITTPNTTPNTAPSNLVEALEDELKKSIISKEEKVPEENEKVKKIDENVENTKKPSKILIEEVESVKIERKKPVYKIDEKETEFVKIFVQL